MVSSLDPRFRSLKFLPSSERASVFFKLTTTASELAAVECEGSAEPPPKRRKPGTELLDFSDDASDSNGSTTSGRSLSVTEKEIAVYKGEDQIKH